MNQSRARRRPTPALRLPKPTSALQTRARAVGAEAFGLLAVDSAKHNFAVLLTNWYAQPLLGPLVVPNTQPDLEALVNRVRDASATHGLRDLVVGIERTGQYHQPIKRTLAAHWTVKMVHPFATKHLRQPDNPSDKTDGRDLQAIVRALLQGYGTDEPAWPRLYQQWQLVNRARETLVSQRAALKIQAQERLQALMAGYTRAGGRLWGSRTALAVLEHCDSPATLAATAPQALVAQLQAAGLSRPDRAVLERLRTWARQAPTPELTAVLQHQLLRDQLSLIRELDRRIAQLEARLVVELVQTPYLLLLSIPGIAVVSASGFGSEAGPMEHYCDARHLNGRAGLYPSRYQSDETNLANGPLARGRNRRLRDAQMEIARNLIDHNHYFGLWASHRAALGWPRRRQEVAIANRFGRIAYHMVAGGQVFEHPCARSRDAVLVKLLRFAQAHELGATLTDQLLRHALGQLPAAVRLAEYEAAARGDWYRHRPRPRTPSGARRRGGGPLGEVVARVLAEWLATTNTTKGGPAPTVPVSGADPTPC